VGTPRPHSARAAHSRRSFAQSLVILIALLVAAIGAPAIALAQDKVVRIDRAVSVSSARPGDRVRLALVVVIPDGLHMQSDKPRDPTLIGARVWIDPASGVETHEVVFPQPRDLRLEGYADPLPVFEGTTHIGLDVALPANAPPGDFQIPGRFRYQACDDKVCFRPRTLETVWTVRVGAEPATPDPKLATIFSGIAFGTGYRPEPGPAPPLDAKPAASTKSGGPSAASATMAALDAFEVAGSEGGYLRAADFLTFIKDAESGVKKRGVFEGRGPLAILAIVFLGGIALNLTPCVLPMIPINLAIIGAGAQAGRRSRGLLLGAAYGGAMAVVYGVLGLIVILTAGTFGTLNASPWFNLGIAALFVLLALAMFDVIVVDFSKWSSGIRFGAEGRGTVVLAFSMGAVAALLAGACVAPVVIQVVLFASDLYAKGSTVALALPFVLGLGMALPWPIAGAGIARLPKPGMWMVRVKQAMGVFILVTAAYYGYLAYELFSNRWVDPAQVAARAQEQLKSGWYASIEEGLAVATRDKTPVLIDFWATWCKNCLVMDETTLADPAVKNALAHYTKVKFQAEDTEAEPAASLMRRFQAVGLPHYVILKPR
jgi:thiol:disulfide interchange protein